MCIHCAELAEAERDLAEEEQAVYDIKPEAEGNPALTEHFAKKRAETLAAIMRGLQEAMIGGDAVYQAAVAEVVLAELESYWRSQETFT